MPSRSSTRIPSDPSAESISPQRRLPWAPPSTLRIRTVAALTVGFPLLLGAATLPPSMWQLGVLFGVAGAVLFVGAMRAVGQPSLRRALLTFVAVQVPHFGWLAFLSLRHPRDFLIAPPHAEFLALPGIVLLAVALTDFFELALVMLAWRANRRPSHEATDRFLANASLWLVGTAVLRWPPLMAALDLEDYSEGRQVPYLPLRGLIQAAVGIVALSVAAHRLRARRRWLEAVRRGENAEYRFVDDASIPSPNPLPLISGDGAPSIVMWAESPSSAYRERCVPVARVGDPGVQPSQKGNADGDVIAAVSKT